MSDERVIPVSVLRAWIKGLKFGDATLVTIADLEKSIEELDRLCNEDPRMSQQSALQQALSGGKRQ